MAAGSWGGCVHGQEEPQAENGSVLNRGALCTEEAGSSERGDEDPGLQGVLWGRVGA